MNKFQLRMHYFTVRVPIFYVEISRRELNVGEKIYRSQGGYDFFLLELNYDGEITNFKIFGGSNDDFVRCIDLLHDQIILGGDFSSSTLLWQRISSKGIK